MADDPEALKSITVNLQPRIATINHHPNNRMSVYGVLCMSIIKHDPNNNRITPAEAFRELRPAIKGVVAVSALWGTARVARGAVKLARRTLRLAPTLTAASATARDIIVPESSALAKPSRRLRAGFVRITIRERRTHADGQTTEDEVSFTVEYADGESES